MKECGLWDFGLEKHLNTFKWGLLDQASRRSMEDSCPEDDFNCRGLAQEVSREEF